MIRDVMMVEANDGKVRCGKKNNGRITGGGKG